MVVAFCVGKIGGGPLGVQERPDLCPGILMRLKRRARPSRPLPHRRARAAGPGTPRPKCQSPWNSGLLWENDQDSMARGSGLLHVPDHLARGFREGRAFHLDVVCRRPTWNCPSGSIEPRDLLRDCQRDPPRTSGTSRTRSGPRRAPPPRSAARGAREGGLSACREAEPPLRASFDVPRARGTGQRPASWSGGRHVCPSTPLASWTPRTGPEATLRPAPGPTSHGEAPESSGWA